MKRCIGQNLGGNRASKAFPHGMTHGVIHLRLLLDIQLDMTNRIYTSEVQDRGPGWNC